MGLCLLFSCTGCQTEEERERERQAEQRLIEERERRAEFASEMERRAGIEELLEQAWNKYRTTNNPELRKMLEEHNSEFSGYVINGRPLRELLQQYPHR